MTRITATHLVGLLAVATITTLTPCATAGPTVSADLDLGTATKSRLPISDGCALFPVPAPLYTVGFTLRTGWRFDVGPLWIVPELGGSFGIERWTSNQTLVAGGLGDSQLGRLFGGARIGWAGVVLAPALRFESALFGHLGAGWYDSGAIGSAFDVGLSLDLRIRERFIVGVQVAYDVVTVWPSGPDPICGPENGFACGSPPSPVADPWVTYGIHAGWLFW